MAFDRDQTDILHPQLVVFQASTITGFVADAIKLPPVLELGATTFALDKFPVGFARLIGLRSC